MKIEKEPTTEVRIRHALKVVESLGKDYNVDPEELATISADIRVKPREMRKLAGMMVYIRKRMIEKLSRIKAFEIAFPERCYTEDGKRVHDITITTKALRLEAQEMYKQVMSIISAPLHVAYAFDRYRVLDKALEISMDDSVTTRDRYQYMKLFLDETKKPDDLKGMEVNVNLTQNNVSIRSVEQHLGEIAKKFQSIDASAEGIIDAIVVQKEKKENQEGVVE